MKGLASSKFHVHVKGIDGQGVGLDTISFDDSHVVIIDGNMICRTTTEVDETESVALALLDIHNRQRCSRATSVASLSVDQGRVGGAGDQ